MKKSFYLWIIVSTFKEMSKERNYENGVIDIFVYLFSNIYFQNNHIR